MLPISRTFLATIISAAFLPTAFADESSSDSVPEIVPVDQCIAPEENSADPAQETVKIEADSIHAEGKDKAVYQGDVIVTQGHKKITADKVTLNQSESSVVADGNVTMNDGQIKSTSNKAKSDFKGERIELHDTKYQLLCQPARGEATYILKDGQSIYTMEDGSLTTCPEGNKSWRVKATDIDIDNEEEEATFYNTRFEILDFPVFYWPYITVPIGDKRKTGFLYPSGGYDSKNGLEINVPIYFNIAPQYDLTTTVNYMQRRGVQFENEFRYLTDGFGAGSLDFEYLHDDDLYSDKGSRWGVNFSHDGIYDRHWKFSVDYSRVSDNDYFADLDSNIGNREDGQLLQAGEVSYRTDYSDTTLKVRDFQVLSSSQPYRLMPQLQYEYNRPDVLPHIDMEWNSHISRFETDDDDLPDATRVHLEPGVVVPFYAPWGQLTSEAKLMYTYYDQDLKNGTSASSDLKENASRTVPEYRMTGTLFLDNSQKWLGGYTQTLEPRLQYLYIPEVDQDDIYQGYDTTLMQLDYYGLFRDMKYSSVDYIAPANQFSYGATSRFYDENYKERFNVSLGQIYYINPESGEANLSAWALENEWNINDEWLFKGGVQYDGDISELQLANSTLEYKLPGGGYTQLNYRYIAKSYIEDNATNLSNVDQYTRDGISQAGILNSFTIAQRWSVQANYYHDLTEQTMLESLVGVTYNDDCWFLGLTYSRHIMNSGDVRNVYPEPGPEYESKVSLNIGIKGLGQSAGLTYSDGGNALGYGRPFSLAD